MSMISARMGSAAGVTLLTLAGCGSVGVALGVRTRLDKLPVSALSASLSPEPSLTPGKSGRLVIVASGSDGKTWTTVGPGHGTVLFDSFELESTVVKVNGSGTVWLPRDPRVSSGKSARVHIKVVGHPDIQADLDVPLKYNLAYAAHFQGASGNDGFSGTDGLAGADGTPGSLDVTNPLAGGSGGNGSNGSDGGTGGDGFPGQTVHVWVTMQPGPEHFLEVRAQGSGKREDYFLVDPDGGSLTIDANGGDGGRGGTGGRGGRGGSGGIGSPNGTSGSAGMDGSDGRPGSEGPPGNIIVTIDPAADIYRGKLHFTTHGRGRAGPAAQFNTEPVPPLW